MTPREAVERYLRRIEAHAELNAYITVRTEEALVEAESAPRGPLNGTVVAVKDNIAVAGTRMTAASRPSRGCSRRTPTSRRCSAS